ncbi:Hypothetical protein A7982_07531 [Minicystis rosea]|nr:Hypothetical protein A7982_07531 [Minicystis rosea]
MEPPTPRTTRADLNVAPLGPDVRSLRHILGVAPPHTPKPT